MTRCELCPRRCGAQRAESAGLCRVQGLRVGRAALHFGEEPCISTPRGSGTVFFAGCPLGCVYCQNHRLSRGEEGQEISVERLAAIFRRLEREKGAANLNLVTGTQFVPEIVAALELARPGVPVVWNSSGYERVETLRTLAPHVDVWLADMKYALAPLAARYSRAPDYPAVARAAIGEMFRLSGPFVLDEEGRLLRGVLIRHLALPGAVDNTRAVIDWVGGRFGEEDVLFSLMAQYTPCGELGAYPELQRTLTEAEWEECLAALEASPITRGFVQELDAAGEEAIPAFDGTGV